MFPEQSRGSERSANVTPSAAIAPETYSAAVRMVDLSYWK
jgi:hypothetical protein